MKERAMIWIFPETDETDSLIFEGSLRAYKGGYAIVSRMPLRKLICTEAICQDSHNDGPLGRCHCE
jgi:hypothetical protein